MVTRPRARRSADAPAGFGYWPDFLDPAAGRALLDEIERMPFRAFEFRGVAARRRVCAFGWGYDFETRSLVPGPDVPPSLITLRDEVAPLADRPAERFEEVLVTEYPPGATIGWHRDAPAFGSTVVGVSLASTCRMRFRRDVGGAWETWERELEPRSAYLLSGAARTIWQHSIPPTPELRYSVTYRTLRASHRPAAS